ncbi:hypothetical protein V5O48_003716 [Marasmius crinis-equi]|uniref:HMG box domain-containing protein n=1 Tax=Marasmius crinis-equi TaxID=585013 RepID=A0ABR3FS21_9AGAR
MPSKRRQKNSPDIIYQSSDSAVDSTEASLPPTRDPRVPRPANQFMIFRKVLIEWVKTRAFPRMMMGRNISMLASNVWKNMDHEDKQKYATLAEQVKTAHALRYPDYQYRPRRRSLKEKAMEMEKKRKKYAKRNPVEAGKGPKLGSPLVPTVSRPIPSLEGTSPYQSSHLVHSQAAPSYSVGRLHDTPDSFSSHPTSLEIDTVSQGQLLPSQFKPSDVLAPIPGSPYQWFYTSVPCYEHNTYSSNANGVDNANFASLPVDQTPSSVFSPSPENYFPEAVTQCSIKARWLPYDLHNTVSMPQSPIDLHQQQETQRVTSCPSDDVRLSTVPEDYPGLTSSDHTSDDLIVGQPYYPAIDPQLEVSDVITEEILNEHACTEEHVSQSPHLPIPVPSTDCSSPPIITSRNKSHSTLKKMNDEHIVVLNNAFLLNSSPSKDTRVMLAKSLGISARSVNMWFLNKRSTMIKRGDGLSCRTRSRTKQRSS